MQPLIAAHHIDPIGFSDTEHVKNFVRYLFSQTRKHPETAATEHNLVFEMEPERPNRAQWARYNTDPKGNLKTALKRVSAETSADEWLNDLTYFAFLIPAPSGAWVCNFMAGNANDGSLASTSDDAAGLCVQIAFGGDDNAFQGALGQRMAQNPNVTDYASAALSDRAAVDQILAKHVQKSHPQRVVMGAFHNDQDSICHLHRIIAP